MMLVHAKRSDAKLMSPTGRACRWIQGKTGLNVSRDVRQPLHCIAIDKGVDRAKQRTKEDVEAR